MILYYCDKCEKQVVPELLSDASERYVLYKLSSHGAVRDELILCKECQKKLENFLKEDRKKERAIV